MAFVERTGDDSGDRPWLHRAASDMAWQSVGFIIGSA